MTYASLKLERFRVFRELELSGLSQINLITGKNNVGKTAFLESIFIQLAPGNPELATRLNTFRGVDRLRAEADELWGWLFFNRDLKSIARLTATTPEAEVRTLSLRLSARSTVAIETHADIAAPSVASSASPLTDLVISYEDSAGRNGTARASLGNDGNLELKSADIERFPGGNFVLSHRFALSQDAERFSKLEEVGRHDTLLPTLRLLEPRLRRLTISVTAGTPALKADIGIGRLIPITLLGEGTVRLLSFLLAISSVPGGVVLIDEFENGLHHSVLTDVWAAVAESAAANNVQIFATTHSWENVRAAHMALSSRLDYPLSLFRFERKDGDITAVTYDKESVEGAIRAEFEVR